MGKIIKILENELVGSTQTTDIYPVTSIKAVYDESNERLDNIIRRKGIVNISTNYNSNHIAEVFTLVTAIAKVPLEDRVLGFQGKYLAFDGWHTIIYIGDSLTDWEDTTKWIDLADKVFNSISKNATFAGIATPNISPGTPDGPVFWIASEPGVYVNFGNTEIDNTGIFTWDETSWSFEKLNIDAYTKAESDARYLRGEVLYEDYYYPNMSPTTDTTRFTDSTEILQPTKFIGEYTDESGQKYNCVFECDSFPDWFDFAERNCYPYGNGISIAVPFFKNYTIDNGELVYNFDSMQNINNISKKLPYFTNNVGLKKIDDNHFNLYTAKYNPVEFTSIDKENVDCSLFAFGPTTYNTIYDVDDCKRFRVSLIGNFQQPSKYSTIISSGSDISIKGNIQRQQLYGNEYVDLEIDKLNKRYRQIGAGYSMWSRTSHTQNWNQATQESFYSQCTLGWSNIPNDLAHGVCNVEGKLIYSFNGYNNPLNLLIMGCKIKIEKLA